MEGLLERIEGEINGLVDAISRYAPIESNITKIADLDKELVCALKDLRAHAESARNLEALEAESHALDAQISDTLVGLSECRKQLETRVEESGPAANADAPGTVNVEELLNYATKITRFTHQQPGTEPVLPWPTEDQIRRGMLATLAVESGAETVPNAVPQVQESADMQVESDVVVQPRREDRPAGRANGAPKKISLDFDSDED